MTTETPNERMLRFSTQAARLLRGELPEGELDAEGRAAAAAIGINLLKTELNERRAVLTIFREVARRVVDLADATPGTCPFHCAGGIDGHADTCPVPAARWAMRHSERMVAEPPTT